MEGMNFPKISKLASRVRGNYADHFSTRAHTHAHQLQFDVIQWLPAEVPRATLQFLDGFKKKKACQKHNKAWSSLRDDRIDSHHVSAVI